MWFDTTKLNVYCREPVPELTEKSVIHKVNQSRHAGDFKQTVENHLQQSDGWGIAVDYPLSCVKNITFIFIFLKNWLLDSFLYGYFLSRLV